MRSTHSQKLERWLGREGVEEVSRMWRGYHGPDPIPIANVPGRVYATNDGDFVGAIKGGYFASLADYWSQKVNRVARRAVNSSVLHAGFSSVSDMISEITTGGKLQVSPIAKAGVTGVSAVSNTLWDVGNQPSAGSTSAAPGGSSPDNTTTGGLKQSNPAGGDGLYFMGANIFGDTGNRTLLLYDRFFQVNHNIATDPQAVSGTPTRYQSTAAKGAFITVHVTTALGAGTPTYEITYVDQDGNAAEASATQTIVGSSIARRFPFAATVGAGWYFPLNAGDTGARSITNLNLSAASTGNVDVVLGKPIATIPIVAAGVAVPVDATLSPWMMVTITDSACLALLEMTRNSTTATNYGGVIFLGSG